MEITKFSNFEQYVQVTLSLNEKAMKSIVNCFEKISGDFRPDLKPYYQVWLFPSFVTEQILQEIIYNTCFECGGLMKDGEALDNTWVSSNDFGNDAGHRGTTISKIGQPVIKQVRKCISCGHSHI